MENYPTASYEAFAGLSSNILRFINRHSGDDDQLTQQSHGTYYKMWSGAEICAQFKEMGLTEESLSKFIVRKPMKKFFKYINFIEKLL